MAFTQTNIFDESEPPGHSGSNGLNRILLVEIRKLGRDLSGIRQAHQQLTDRIHQIEDWRRRPFPPSVVNTYLKVVSQYFNDRCPCCGETRILSSTGSRHPVLEVDHYRGCQWNKITDGWPICNHCHKDLTHGYLSRDGWVLQAFRAFQMRVNQYISTKNGGRQTMLFNF